MINRYIYRSSKNPESLARGVGLGLFIGFLPAIGFQVVLAFLVAGPLNANRLVTMLGTLVTNPFTALPVGAFSLWIGDWILPGTHLTELSKKSFEWNQIFDSSGQLGVSYLVGCLLLSTIGGSVGYVVARIYFKYFRSGPTSQRGSSLKGNL